MLSGARDESGPAKRKKKKLKESKKFESEKSEKAVIS